MENIKLKLLDNGIDYIHEAVKPLLENPSNFKHSWKYSVLHLYSGIELLLKEKLKQEHWSLIFEEISSASVIKLENGDFVSVYHNELIKRLRNIAKVNFNDEPIKKLRQLRNRFEHYEVDISLSECQHTVAAALDEIIKFWEVYLKSVSTVQQETNFKEIKSTVTKFNVYRKQRLDKSEQIISGIVGSKNGLRVLCPDCSSFSFVVLKNNEKECQCFVCDEKYRKQDYLKNIRNFEEDEKTNSFVEYVPYDTICSSCQEETRVRYVLSPTLALYCCLNCLKEEQTYPKLEQVLSDVELEQVLKVFEYKYTPEELNQILINVKKQMCLGKD